MLHRLAQLIVCAAGSGFDSTVDDANSFAILYVPKEDGSLGTSAVNFQGKVSSVIILQTSRLVLNWSFQMCMQLLTAALVAADPSVWSWVIALIFFVKAISEKGPILLPTKPEMTQDMPRIMQGHPASRSDLLLHNSAVSVYKVNFWLVSTELSCMDLVASNPITSFREPPYKRLLVGSSLLSSWWGHSISSDTG